MMWYGRRNFLLSDKTQTLAAILLPHMVDERTREVKFDTWTSRSPVYRPAGQVHAGRATVPSTKSFRRGGSRAGTT